MRAAGMELVDDVRHAARTETRDRLDRAGVDVDAIEMLDAARIGGLLDFFADHARYVVAAALPEAAERLRERFEALPPTACVEAS